MKSALFLTVTLVVTMFILTGFMSPESNKCLLNPNDREMFEPWKDPKTGITSYILKKQVAPIQQSFYFTNQSITKDGRYLWFYVSFPPSGSSIDGRMLGVADFKLGTVNFYPETAFRASSAMVDTDDGTVYWCEDYAVYSRRPEPDAKVKFINSIPKEIHKNRPGLQLSNHLTRSADKKEFLIDAMFGREYLVGTLPLDGNTFSIWQRFDRRYNHGQFSPTDSNIALIAQDWWPDVATGERTEIENRIWIIRRGENAEPIFTIPDHGEYVHEWWAADGKAIWFVDYSKGTCKVDLATRQKIIVWPNGVCHSHCSADENYLVGDIGPYWWRSPKGCRLAFYNVKTHKEINIVSSLPFIVPEYTRKEQDRGKYHLDPHPNFCCSDQFIVYTTTVRGRFDVAVVKVGDLIEATK